MVCSSPRVHQAMEAAEFRRPAGPLRLAHGRAPACAADPNLARPLVHALGEGFWRCRAACGRAACGGLVWRARAPGAVDPVHPGSGGLCRHAADHSDRRDTLAVQDGKDCEPTLDLASSPPSLGGCPLVFDCLPVLS